MACLIWSYSLYDVSVEYQGWCVLQITLQVVIHKCHFLTTKISMLC